MMAKTGPKPRPLRERFWSKVQMVAEDGCWLWQGSTNGHGYGVIHTGSRSVSMPSKRRINYAHRVVYENVIGPIPKGFQVDHLCNVPNCVNPEHLETVTPAENRLRGERLTTCRRKHAKEHIYTRRNGVRACRACDRFNAKAYRERNAETGR